MEIAEDDLDIYEILRDRPSSLSVVVPQFIERCKQESSGHLLSAVGLFFRCSLSDRQAVGDDGGFRIPEHLFDSKQVDHILDLFCNFIRDHEGIGEGILLFGNDSSSKAFQKAFEGFWNKFVRDFPAERLVTIDFSKSLLQWLLAMSESGSRSLRYTATLTLYVFVDSFIEHMSFLKTEMSVLEVQIRTVNKHNFRTKSLEKQRNLAEKLDSASSAIKRVENFYDKIFDDVLVPKSRDSFHEVRCLSASALSRWIRCAPDHFLHDDYIKHLGWLLYDKNASVRCAVLNGLSDILVDENSFFSMDMFLRKFKNRLLEMIRDENEGACVAALRLFQQLLRFEHADIPSETKLVDLCIYDKSIKVRESAGKVISQLICLRCGRELQTRKRGSRSLDIDSILSSSLIRQSRDPSRSWKYNPSVKNLDTADFRREMEELVRILQRSTLMTKDSGIFRYDALEGIVHLVESIWGSLPSLHALDAFVEILCSNDEEPPETLSGANVRLIMLALLVSVLKHSEKQKAKSSSEDSSLGKTDRLAPFVQQIYNRAIDDQLALMMWTLIPRFLGEELYKDSQASREVSAVIKCLMATWERCMATDDKAFAENVYGTFAKILSVEFPDRADINAKVTEIGLACFIRLVTTLQNCASGGELRKAVLHCAVYSKYFPPKGEMSIVDLTKSFVHERLVGTPCFDDNGAALELAALVFYYSAWAITDWQQSAEFSNGKEMRDLLPIMNEWISGEYDAAVKEAAVESICSVVTTIEVGNSSVGPDDIQFPSIVSKEDIDSSGIPELVGSFFLDFWLSLTRRRQRGSTSGKIRCLAGICQALLLSALPRRLAHLPLTLLAQKESQQTLEDNGVDIHNIVKQYHQKWKERHPKECWEIELGALLYVASNGSRSLQPVTQLARALGMRYAFARTKAHPVARLVIGILKYELDSDQEERVLEFASAALSQLVPKVNAEAAASVKSSLQLRLSKVSDPAVKKSPPWKSLLRFEEALEKQIEQLKTPSVDVYVDVAAIPAFYGIGNFLLGLGGFSEKEESISTFQSPLSPVNRQSDNSSSSPAVTTPYTKRKRLVDEGKSTPEKSSSSSELPASIKEGPPSAPLKQSIPAPSEQMRPPSPRQPEQGKASPAETRKVKRRRW